MSLSLLPCKTDSQPLSSSQGSQVSLWRPSMPGTVCLAGGPVGSRPPHPHPRAECVSCTVELCPHWSPEGTAWSRNQPWLGLSSAPRPPGWQTHVNIGICKKHFQWQEVNLDSFRWETDLEIEGPRHGFIAFQS